MGFRVLLGLILIAMAAGATTGAWGSSYRRWHARRGWTLQPSVGGMRLEF